MTKAAPPASVMRFRQRLTALRQAPRAKEARLTFQHAVNAGGLDLKVVLFVLGLSLHYLLG